MKLDPRFKDTEYTVEADMFAKHTLWQNFSTEALECQRIKLNTAQLCQELQYRVKWIDDNMGYSMQIGEVNKRPVCVTFFWTKIDNRLVMFYHATSEIVDHKMVNDWLKKYCNPQDKGCSNNCDANNFHNCLIYIRNANNQKN